MTCLHVQENFYFLKYVHILCFPIWCWLLNLENFISLFFSYQTQSICHIEMHKSMKINCVMWHQSIICFQSHCSWIHSLFLPLLLACLMCLNPISNVYSFFPLPSQYVEIAFSNEQTCWIMEGVMLRTMLTSSLIVSVKPLGHVFMRNSNCVGC